MNSTVKAALICLFFVQSSMGCLFIFTTGTGRSVDLNGEVRNEIDDPQTVIDLALKAFSVCEKDGQNGLTWTEVNNCNGQFCSIMNIACPDEDDFNAFDINGDGVVEMSEYVFVITLQN